MWHFKVGFIEHGFVGEAADFNKQKAKQLASQKFLELIFPAEQTWMGLCQVIPSNKGMELVQWLKPELREIYESSA